MPSTKDTATALRGLARFSGLQTSYRNDRGIPTDASEAGLVGVLKALYPELDDGADFGAFRRGKEAAYWHWQAEPVAVAWDGRLASVELRMPAAATGVLECHLQLESGESKSWSATVDDLPAFLERDLGEQRFVARRLDLEGLPDGYHRLHIETRGFSQDVLLISAPTRAYERPGKDRRWGAFLPLYALHSRTSWGAGDFSDLGRFGDWVSARGGGLVATLPLLPSYLSEPFEPSPYMPVSRLFWNEFYVDPRQAPDFQACDEALALVASREFQREVDELRAEPYVDYGHGMLLRRRVMSLLAQRAFRAGDLDLRSFLQANPDVSAYARFRSQRERLSKPWREWFSHEEASEDEAYRFYAFSQFLAGRQLREIAERSRERGDEIYLDLPLGCHADGYDTWRYPDSFADGASCGAPPDGLSAAGQDWGFPPLHPLNERATGYELFRRVIAHHLSLANVLRIDHVMGLHRLYWVPRGMSARDGVYVRYRGEELYAILCLESHRSQATIMGENLGTVPSYVNEALARHGIYKMYVMQYELPIESGKVQPPPLRSFATLNTHDMPTFSGFLAGRDIDLRLELGTATEERSAEERHERELQRDALDNLMHSEGNVKLSLADPGEAVKGVLHHLAASRARYLLVNLEDLWLEPEPQNIPGTPSPGLSSRAQAALQQSTTSPGEQVAAVPAGKADGHE